MILLLLNKKAEDEEVGEDKLSVDGHTDVPVSKMSEGEGQRREAGSRPKVLGSGPRS